MGGKIRFNVAKFGAKVASQVSKFGFGSGNNLPGYVFYKIAGKEALKDLAHEMSIGPILITGTNGKTTTTTLLIKLLSADTKIRKSFESNTIHAITTGILKGDGDLGVFEYGIRNKSYGIPDTVQRLIDPVGVVYTTIYEMTCMLIFMDWPLIVLMIFSNQTVQIVQGVAKSLNTLKNS